MGFFDSIGNTLSEVFTPKNVIDAVGVFSAVKGKGDAEKAASDALNNKYAHDIDLENLRFANEMAMLQAKLAAGSGSGGSGDGGVAAQIAYNKAKDKYQGRMGASETAIKGNQDRSALTLQALRNLIEGAQAPLIR